MELNIDRVTKQYGPKIAVDRISLTLTPGVTGLLGANGAVRWCPQSAAVIYHLSSCSLIGAIDQNQKVQEPNQRFLHKNHL